MSGPARSRIATVAGTALAFAAFSAALTATGRTAMRSAPAGPTRSPQCMHESVDGERVILRLSGDRISANTIVPEIAKNFLERNGTTNVRICNPAPPDARIVYGLPRGDTRLMAGSPPPGVAPDPGRRNRLLSTTADGRDIVVSGTAPDGRIAVLIRANDTQQGFIDISGRYPVADIALASRGITPLEVRDVEKFDEATLSKYAVSDYYVPFARTAIVVIAHKARSIGTPIPSLSLHDLQIVFGAQARPAASALAHRRLPTPPPLRIYAPAPGTAVRDVFDAVVGPGESASGTPSRSKSPSARIVASDEVPARVAADDNALGTAAISDALPLLNLGQLSLVDIRQAGSRIAMFDEYSLTTGDYPLTLTLAMYRDPRVANVNATRLFDEAQSVRTQALALDSGFFLLSPQLLPRPASWRKAPLPSAYLAATANAMRISTTIRFNSGKPETIKDDPFNLRQLARLAAYLRALKVPAQHIEHIAFSDGANDSRALGAYVVQALREKNVAENGTFLWFDDAMPLATDKTIDGRKLNRRVETWITAPAAGTSQP